MNIYNVTGIDGYTLLIYRPLDRLYRFSIIDLSGTVFSFDSVFLTADEAAIHGRKAIEMAYEFDREGQQY